MHGFLQRWQDTQIVSLCRKASTLGRTLCACLAKTLNGAPSTSATPATMTSRLAGGAPTSSNAMLARLQTSSTEPTTSKPELKHSMSAAELLALLTCKHEWGQDRGVCWSLLCRRAEQPCCMRRWNPLAGMQSGWQERVEVWNSPLSEAAVLGFE